MKKKKDKNMTKKILSAITLAGVILFVVFIYSRQLQICPNFSYSNCANFFDDFALVLFPIIPLFIFSLITYKMQEEIFQFWWKFARVWIPLSMFAIIISPSTGNWMIPIEKGSVALFSMILFAISSVFIIACKHFQLKNNCL